MTKIKKYFLFFQFSFNFLFMFINNFLIYNISMESCQSSIIEVKEGLLFLIIELICFFGQIFSYVIHFSSCIVSIIFFVILINYFNINPKKKVMI